MPEEARRARRGPKPNTDRGTPSGYRVTARQRFELQVAAPFVGARSLQETIDIAVGEFLAKMGTIGGFSDAVGAAEASQRVRAGIQAVGMPPLRDTLTVVNFDAGKMEGEPLAEGATDDD